MTARHRSVLVVAALFVVLSIVSVVAAQTNDDGTIMAETDAVVSVEQHQPTTRIKDIARFAGVRDNQLLGIGLVIGLEGTGDGRSSQANVQMVANMLERFGITVDRDSLRLRNVAAVTVTADLPAFVRPGDRIDVTVSSLGDARSLQGGFLLQTPLQAADGRVYAVAQGPVSIGGFNVRARGGSQVQSNHSVVGQVPGGAIVEQSVPTTIVEGDSLTLVLTRPDFTTASRIARAINEAFTPDTAVALDRSAVHVKIPSAFEGYEVEFAASIEELTVTPDAVARIVINERTGTVVMGHAVRIGTVAVAHGALKVSIETEPVFAVLPAEKEDEQPIPVVAERTTVQASDAGTEMVLLESGNRVEDVVRALNAIGASPRDIIAILQAIDAAGALYGELHIL